ncbi:hypothetical protein [Rhizobium sp. S163]|uniref:hypothetical protein n=1 Tax=Rhizobium sp. S163 TaxID=3055039 RepID=UPI0025AA0B58|nr:hypothetical protein [Rhizobium sp. S163]MDM9647754.1 hypothetical protein [Rhizobium sp. S163]
MAKKTTTLPIAIDPSAVALYTITETAPPRIAGRRLEVDQKTIELTESQARAELLAGHIVPAAPASNDA